MKNADAPAVKRRKRTGAERNGDDQQEPDHDLRTYVVKFRTAAGEALAISIPSSETAVLKHFQERMPYGLFVPDVP
jgi:hypothetical protein